MSRSYSTAALALLLCSVACFSGCSRDLVLRGKTERLIGETVTLALVEGDDAFSGQLSLEDAGGTTVDPERLNLELVTPRTLSFTIPAGVTAGMAVARAAKASNTRESYRVPLDISRVALAMRDDGNVDTLPLPPSTLTPTTWQGNGSGNGLMALSPRGGLLYVAEDDNLRFFSIEIPLRQVASIRLSGAQAIAALPSGVLVATANGLLAFRYQPGQGILQSGSVSQSNIRALDADPSGEHAAVLFEEDGQDRIFQVNISEGALVARAALVLDTTPGAHLVSIRRDGKLAVVADGGAVYQVDFRPSPPQKETLGWPNVAAPRPVAIARTLATVAGERTDLFAIAEASSKTLRMLAFDANTKLLDVSEAILDEAPTHIAYGLPNQLYVIVGSKLLVVNTGTLPPTSSDPQSLTGQPITRFVVQP